MSMWFWEPSDQKPSREIMQKAIKPELTWDMIEQALDEKRLEILEDYNYLGWLQDEMAKIRRKYEKDNTSDVLQSVDWNFIREDV